MTDLDELIRQLSRMKVQTGSLVCLAADWSITAASMAARCCAGPSPPSGSWMSGGLMPSAPQTPTQP